MPTRKTPRASERKPENVYVMADQLRQQSRVSAGDALAKTPSIDRLTGEDMCFDDAVVSMPDCAASCASLCTGKYTTLTASRPQIL